MTDGTNESETPQIEYVGAPTEFADAQEVPEWVETFAKILVFLPAAMITATTIPIILIGMALVCLALFVLLIMAL
jgi:hypothetical protein